jgi:hypothetical protein
VPIKIGFRVGASHFLDSYTFVPFVPFVPSLPQAKDYAGGVSVPIKSEIKSGIKWVLRTYTLSPRFVSPAPGTAEPAGITVADGIDGAG